MLSLATGDIKPLLFYFHFVLPLPSVWFPLPSWPSIPYTDFGFYSQALLTRWPGHTQGCYHYASTGQWLNMFTHSCRLTFALSVRRLVVHVECSITWVINSHRLPSVMLSYGHTASDSIARLRGYELRTSTQRFHCIPSGPQVTHLSSAIPLYTFGTTTYAPVFSGSIVYLRDNKLRTCRQRFHCIPSGGQVTHLWSAITFDTLGRLGYERTISFLPNTLGRASYACTIWFVPYYLLIFI